MIFSLCFSALLFSIGVFNSLQYWFTIRSNIKVNGVLIELRKNYHSHYTSYDDVGGFMFYPVFEYIVEGTVYTERYRYQAVSGSRLTEIIANSGIPDGTLKGFMKSIAQTEPEYIPGNVYTLIVNKSLPTLFFIENQRVFIKEVKWFIISGMILIADSIFSIISQILL